MTVIEIELLIIGIGIGAQGMAVWHMAVDMRSARRSQTEAEAALKRATGDRFLNSLRLYQLQQRTEVRR